MVKLLAKALDRGVIHMASSFRADGIAQPSHAVEAEKWLARESLFGGVTQSANMEFIFNNETDFLFASPVTTRWEQNNRVHGKLFRAGPAWKSRPSVILLHGWNAELQYRWQFPRLARRLTKSGVNAAIFELSYHCQRRPSETGAI
ncbi:MAG TPA: hypothetical protein VKM56_12835, partial [Verrucomicrobiae bacterium]|nr:hypothetical protein [Verrucomicrobiae bacterium]